MPERLPLIPAASMTPAQQQAVDEFKRSRGVDISGPFLHLLRNPELMRRVRAVGDYVRFESTLPPRLREFAILITAAHWKQQYEWDYHAPIAREAGVTPAHARALAEGSRPESMDDLEQAVYDFCTEVHRTKQVSDDTYHRAVASLGEEGLIDLLGVCGYYAMLAMILNTARTPLDALDPDPAVPDCRPGAFVRPPGT